MSKHRKQKRITRQWKYTRKVVAATVVLCLIGIGASVADIEISGGGVEFFLFRNSGAGAGNSQDLSENQGPGQVGAHHGG